MQYIYIYDNQISGTTDNPNQGLPAGMSIYAYSGNEALEQLYYNGKDVLPIPPKPTGSYIWDANEWRPYSPLPTFSPQPIQPQPAVYSSTLFAEARELAEQESPLLAALFLWVYAESLRDVALVEAAKAKVDTIIKQRKSVVTVTQVNNATFSASQSTTTPIPTGTATTAKSAIGKPRTI